MISELFYQENSKVDWEYLPVLCLFTILEKIDQPISQIHFGAVSRHWQSIFHSFIDYRRRSYTNLVPMLLIPSRKSITKGKLYSLQAKSIVSEIELPKPYAWRYCGSCYGWLAALDEGGIITLSNPFRKVSTIRLPRLEAIDDFDAIMYPLTIPKVVLSDDPLLYPNNYVVIVIYATDMQLAVHKSGRKDWTYIDRDGFSEFNFTDILFHKSLVYAIGHWNNLLSFNIKDIGDDETSKSPNLNILLPNVYKEDDYSERTYLVKSSMGNIYSIHKHLDFEEIEEDRYAHSTERFNVFKLILDGENGELLERKEVNHIDGDIVFLGDNGTLAVSALDFPEGQPNSIYFTDDYFLTNAYKLIGPREIGIFHLKDKSFEKYYQFKSSHKDLPPYIWISPPAEFKSRLSL